MYPAFSMPRQGGSHLKKAESVPVEEVHTQEFLDMIAPSVIKFETDYFICGNTYAVYGRYGNTRQPTDEQAILSHLGERTVSPFASIPAM